LHDAARAAAGCRMVGSRAGEAPGVEFHGESALAQRALDLLQERPRDTEELAREVLGIRGGPPTLRVRLVAELLRAEPAVHHDDDGFWRLEPPSAPIATGLDEVKFAVVDVETTGGVAGRGGRIIEFAAVRIENRQIVEAFTSLVDPGEEVSPWITRLTGIHNGMIRDAPPFSDIVADVRRQLDGCVFVAHNAGYDWGFVREEMRRIGACLPSGPRLCTLQLTRRLLPGLERRGLDAVASYYGIEIQDRHRARGDAIATARILLRMLSDAERKGWSTWPRLQEALTGGRRPRC